MYDNIIKSYTALSRASDTACVFSLWVSFVGVKMSLKIKNKKKIEKKNEKKPKKKRTITARGTTVYDWPLRMTIWRRRAVSSHSVGCRRGRSRRADGVFLVAAGRRTVGGETHRYRWGRPKAVRGGMTGGGTNRNTPRVRVRARLVRGERCLREFSSRTQRRFSTISFYRLAALESREILCVCSAYTDLQNSCTTHPRPALSYFAFYTDLFFYFFFQDTPYSKNRTFVWLRGFLRFSPPKCFIRSAFNAHSIPTRGLYSHMTWCCYPLCSWLIPGLRFC